MYRNHCLPQPRRWDRAVETPEKGCHTATPCLVMLASPASVFFRSFPFVVRTAGGTWGGGRSTFYLFFSSPPCNTRSSKTPRDRERIRAENARHDLRRIAFDAPRDFTNALLCETCRPSRRLRACVRVYSSTAGRWFHVPQKDMVHVDTTKR